MSPFLGPARICPGMSTDSRHCGRIIDLHARRIFPGVIVVRGGRIQEILEDCSVTEPGYLCPGFIDAHVHIESSMLAPAEFGRIAVIHGTTGTVSDPHEIANVLGIDGVRYMQREAERTPLKIHFGIPSCVPATEFETAGAVLGPADIEELCRDASLIGLSEMMNFPGVVHCDPVVMEKLAIAKRYGKRIDGHAPGLRGADLKTYVEAGIETDHECCQIDEALEKLSLGQKILIREGSAAKNFEELWPLLNDHAESCMFCSDDKHPDDLMAGHINQLCARAVAHRVPLFAVLRAACVNPVQHYGLRCGLMRAGDPADFVRLHDLISFRVMETFIDGVCVAREGLSLLPRTVAASANRFLVKEKSAEDFQVTAAPGLLRLIEALDGQIMTGEGFAEALVEEENAVADPSRDILKITVVNRYADVPPAVAFVRGIGLKQGAIASSVAHDGHNIVAVGVDDEAVVQAVNLVIRNKGGIVVVGRDGSHSVLPLPVAGLMSDGYAEDVAEAYARLTREAKALGSTLQAPFMTISFLALLVIPALKLSDRGLFDGTRFEFTPLFQPV